MRSIKTFFRYLYNGVKGIVLLGFTGLAFPLAFVLALLILIYVALPITLPAQAYKPQRPSLPIVLYATNGEKIASFQPGFNIVSKIKPSDLNKNIRQAITSSEDRTFWTNRGVDLKSIVRAAGKDIKSRHIVQGGSTITEQYVKLLYTSRERNITNKLDEIVDAAELARTISKRTLLTNYFNLVYFGDGAYGLAAAAKDYFGIPASKLTLSEAAMLVGLIPNPSLRDPRINPSLADYWRQVVLGEMLEQKDITSQKYHEAVSHHLYIEGCNSHCGKNSFSPPADCLGTTCVRGRSNSGLTPTREQTVIKLRPHTDLGQYPFFSAYVMQWLNSHLSQKVLNRGGLKIQTTLNPLAQSLAEKAVLAHTSSAPKGITESLVSLNPKNGFIQAWIGGQDYRKYQVDLATGGTEGFQGGSSFKPFTLAAALESGIITPNSEFTAYDQYSVPGCTGGATSCLIHNDEGEGTNAPMTIATATAQSVNTVFVQLELKEGIHNVAEMAHKLGISTINPNKHYGASLTLGAYGVTPVDMASAYGVFANGGVRVPATPVSYVQTGKKVILDMRHPKGVQIITPQVALTLDGLLEGVITNGTGTAAQLGRPAAGKTGTTNGPVAGWFVGYTPQLSTSVVMLNQYHPTPLLNIEGIPEVYGGTLPAETWKSFMAPVLEKVKPANFVLRNTPPSTSQSTTPIIPTPTTQVGVGAPTYGTTITPNCNGESCNQTAP
jgi:penicillin-binding protein 1A